MGKKKEKQNLPEDFFDLGDIEDIFGLKEKDTYINFECIECGCIDPVPDYIIGEFSYDLEDGEEVELCCPKCNGAMRRASEKPEAEK